MTSTLSGKAGSRRRHGLAARFFIVITSALMTVSPSSASLLAVDEPTDGGTSGVVNGVVWVDADGDGLLGADEETLSGVTMVLTGNSTGAVTTSPSGDDGAYQLAGTLPGDYRVEALIPDGYQVSPIPESEEGATSNTFTAVEETAQSETFTLASGTELTLNLGLVPTDELAPEEEPTETTTTTTTVPEETTTTTLPPLVDEEIPDDEPGFGILALAPSQQWMTSVGPATTGPGDTMDVAFGTTGVAAILTAVSNTSGPGLIWPEPDEGLNDPGNLLFGPNIETYIEPDQPAGLPAITSGVVAPQNSTAVYTWDFSKPVVAPIVHIVNLDASYVEITGSTTTGAPITLTPVVANAAMEVSGNRLNTTQMPATESGCNLNGVVPPAAGCGSFRLSGASGLIESFTITNVMTLPIPAPGGGDGWTFAVSFPTAPLTKAFEPAVVPEGATSQLTFSITNPNDPEAVTLTHLDFTDNLPSDVTIADTSVSDNLLCGTPNVADGNGDPLAVGATSVQATEISVGVGDTCEITVTVTAPVGTYVNNNDSLTTTVGNLVPDADTTLTVIASPPPLECTGDGLLFQHQAGPSAGPTSVTAINMVTGGTSPLFPSIADRAINAVGYNVLDNYVYGFDLADTPSPTMVRVGAGGVVEELGVPTGVDGSVPIGDVDDEGQYWAIQRGTGQWYQIDLAPGSPTFMEVVDTGIVAALPNSNDWAFVPGTNALYTVDDIGGVDHLVAFDRDTHTFSDLGALGTGVAIASGAMYAAPGQLYTSNNSNGDIYRIDIAAVSGELFATGPASSGNDGARCPIPIELDFGDAPDSYGTTLGADGPRHPVTDDLTLGSTIDAEDDGQPTTAADGDGADEDGVAAPIVRALGVDTVVMVSVTNDTGEDATLAGWIDLDSNGVFDASELQTATVTSSGDYDLTFDAPTEYGSTFARFRLFPAGTDPADILPTGPASAGEVEDYPVTGPELPTFVCDSTAYLFQNVPTDIHEGDLVTGVFGEVASDIEDTHINGIGFNVLDGYIYGWSNSAAPGGTSYPAGLVRIGSDYNVEYLGIPDGLSESTLIGHGDVDTNGYYWARRTDVDPDQWVQIDLRPGEPTFGDIVASGDLVPPTGFNFLPDWSYNPVDGLLYGIGAEIGGGPSGARHLISFDPDTKAVNDEGQLLAINGGAFGATYVDPNGFLYASDNNTGDIYRIDVANVTAEFFVNGPGSGGQNDGARCAVAPLPVDFGDAADSFGTTLATGGPRHAVPGYDAGTNTAPLMLGSLIDIETDGVPTPGSDGDDTADIDDEDAVAGPITFTAGQPTTVPVTVTNDTSEPATLAAWADLDGSGTFDADELTTVAIGANSGTLAHDVDFGAAFPVCQNVRFRLFPGTVTDPSPTGPAATGEVEDHPVVVEPDCTADDIPLTISGFAQAWTPGSTWQNATGNTPVDALNAPDGEFVQLWQAQNNVLTLDLSTVVPEGNAVTLHLANASAGFVGPVEISSSADGSTFGGSVTHTPTETGTTFEEFNYVVPAGGARFIRITPLDNGDQGSAVRVDAATYSFVTCECEDAVNFVVDGSFEAFGECSTQAGDFGAWSVIDVNTHIWGENCPLGWDSPDGVNSMDLDGSTTGGAEQLITGLTPGNSYNLTFYMAFNPAAGADSSSMRVQIADFDETYTSASNATLGGFNLVHVEFTADSPNELLRFESLTGSGDPDLLNGGGTAGFGVVIDDVRITAKDCDEIPLVHDFGDAPDSYGTTLAAGGPQHAIPGYDPTTNSAPVMLGINTIDPEPDGLPTPAADGDDLDGVDDESGVLFNPALGYATPVLRTGLDPASLQPVENTLQVEASTPGFVSAWVDWNQDGDFDDAGEQVANAEAVTAGLNDITFSQGTNPDDISTYVRVRYSTDEGSIATPYGPALDGEVEDYQVLIERLNQPDACVESGTEYQSFTFTDPVDLTGDGTPPSTARYENVTVVKGVAVDMFVEVIAGANSTLAFPPNGFLSNGGDNAAWSVSSDVTIRYTFYEAGTTTPVAINGVFTVNDVDDIESATFNAADLASYAVTQGSAVSIIESGGNVTFDGNGNWNGDPESRFQIVLQDLQTMDVRWQGSANSGFGFDGDGDLSIQPPACEDWGDAPDSYGTTAAANGPNHTIDQGVFLGSLIDFDTDGQPSTDADGDDTTNLADEDGVAFNPALGYPSPTLRTGLDPVSLQPVENTLEVEASEDGFVSVWVDWNQDGDFDDPGEQVANAEAVTAGLNDITFSQGTNPDDISTYVRVRYSTDEGSIATPYGLAPDGEVEDYQVLIERLNQPDACVDSGEEYYSFTFSTPTTTGTTGGVGDTARYENVSVINGVAVDMFVEVLAGDLRQDMLPPNGMGVLDGGGIGPDDARWQISGNATLRYTFYEAGTTNPVSVNAVFTVNDMDAPELATFNAADLASYAVTQGSSVVVTESGGNVAFDGTVNGAGTQAQRFQVVFEGISTFDANWQGFNGSGFGFDGDGDLSIQPPACEDWSDAPDSYGTTAAANGPNHTIVPGLLLGDEIDFDADGQPSVGADGDDLNRLDDEDGVAINPSIPGNVMVTQAGGLNTAEITVTGSGFLSAWIDLDQNGVFDPGEAIFDDVPVADGVNSLAFTVPDTVPHGQTYARFRLTSQEGVANTPTGPAPDGEVEDYLVHVAVPVSQACEAGLVNSGFEAPAVTGTTPFIQQFGGGTIKIYHENVVPGWSFVAADPNAGTEAQRNAIEIWGTANPAAYEGSQFAEINAYVFGYLYQDMVTTPGSTLTWEFAHRGRSGDDTIALNIGAPGATVTVTTETTDNTGWQLYVGQYVVPAGQFITRFEFEAVSSAGGNAAAGNFLDGIAFGIECPTDFGDAPASYGTSLVDDGARHQISVYDEGTNTAELMLGSSIDKELDGPPGPDADGDDLDETADEDGVVDPIVLAVGDPTTVTVSVTNDTGEVATLAGWIDLDGSGTFDAGEMQTLTIPANTTGDFDLVFPAATTTDLTYARFRLFPGTVADPLPTGPASGGEVEDFLVQVSGFEVAKTANPVSGTAVSVGDTVTYTLTLTNIGTVALTGVEVDDNLAGVLDDADLISGPLVTPAIAGTATVNAEVLSFVGDLGVGDVVTVSYMVEVLDPSESGGDGVLENAVVGGDCPDPAITDPQDPDFDPDCVNIHPVRDVTIVKSSDPADGSTVAPGDDITYTVEITNTGGYEYTVGDPAEVIDDLSRVIDDAFYNNDADDAGHAGILDYTAPELTWTGPLEPDETVTITYTVTVLAAENLGDAVLENTVTGVDSNCVDPAITDTGDLDYNPDCHNVLEVGAVQYLKTVDPPDPLSLQPGDPYTYTVTVTNVGATDLTGLTFTDDLSGVLDDATFDIGSETADIGTAAFNGTDAVVWSGDLDEGEVASITYGVTIDDPITGDSILINGVIGTGPGSNCPPPGPATDADCFKQIPQPLINTVKTSNQVGNVAPGDIVIYEFTVSNTGTGPAHAFEVVDDLSDVLDDASYDGNVTLVTGPGGVVFDPVNQEVVWTGPLDVGEFATVTYSVTVNDATDLGDGVLLNAVTSPDCFDSPVTDPDDPNFNPDCVTITLVKAWTAVKTSDAVGNVQPGDVLTYEVTVTNTGGVDLTATDVVNNDDLTQVLDDAVYNSDADDDGHPGIFEFTAPILSWSGDLIVDQVVTLTYSVTVNDATELGDGQLLNAVTGAPNCPDPAVTDPDDPNFNPDCVVMPDIEAWTSVKTSNAGDPVLPGDVITYEITVTNTGNVDLTAADVSIEDDLTGVIDDAVYNGDADQGATYVEPILSWSGDLIVDQVVTLTYSVTVNDATELGDGQLLNAVTGAPNCPDPAVTDPDDPNFNPDCVVMPDIEAWTSVKTSNAGDPVLPGDVITYEITVTNTGNVSLDQPGFFPSITDNLTGVLDDASYNSDADSSGVGLVTYGEPLLQWEGPLAVDDVVIVTYTVTVNDADELGDGQLLNAVTGAPNCSDPAVTDPDDPGFNPDCVVMPDIEAWMSVKTSNAGDPVLTGDTIEYTVTVTNTGNVDLTAAQVSIEDDLTAVIDDAAYNNDESATSGLVSHSAPFVSWSGDLAVDQVVTITYSVTVNDADDLGDGQLLNAVTGAPNCPDPAVFDPGDPDFNPDCVVDPLVSAYTAVKSSVAPAPVLPGAIVEYSVVVTNTGGTDLVGPEAAVFSDDLSGVLDDASFNGEETADIGSVGFAEPVLSWSGDLLVGEVATVTYSVTVDAPITGDFSLTNAIVGGDCPDPAVTDPEDPGFDPDCVNVVLLPGVDISKVIFGDPVTELQPGDSFDYVVTVSNIGQVDLVGESFSDDLNAVLDDAALDVGSLNADVGVVNYVEPEITWIGDLAVGGVATVTYTIVIDDPITGDGELLNGVLGSIYSNCVPPDPDDPDCWEETPLPNVIVGKELVGPANPQPGDVVIYRITAENRGGATAIDEVITDDLSGVVDDAAYNNDASASFGTVKYNQPVLSWVGDIPAGQMLTLTYTVTVNQPAELGDAVLENAVTGGENCPEDIELCTTNTPLPTYEATKQLVSPTEPEPGDVITYQVSIVNTGQVIVEAAVIHDNLSDVLDEAVYNNEATATAGTVSYTEPTLTWNGPLAVGETVTLSYTVTVNGSDDLGNAVLVNTLTAPNCSTDAGSLGLLAEEGCSTETPLPAVRFQKVIISPADGQTRPGGTVTYRVTASNTGAVDLEDLWLTDDLTEVLDHATYLVAEASASLGTLSYTEPTLRWDGDLAAGETATILYSVRLDTDAPRGVALNNLVVGSGPGSNCPPTSTEPACLAAMVLSASTLPFTGIDLLALLLGALALVVVGAFIGRAGRERWLDETPRA